MTSAPALDTLNPHAIAIRKTLIRNGYRPVPVDGKRPLIKGWQRLRMSAEQVEGYARTYPGGLNTGIICGDVIAIDIDTPDPSAAAHLTALANGLPGAERALQRVGKAPKITFVFRAKAAGRKIATGKYLIDGQACQVEILAGGQQFVAFGVHPDTGAEYTWLTLTPLDVPLAELPEIDAQTINEFVAAAETFLAKHGEPISKPKAAKAAVVVSGDKPWDRVNAAAFQNLDAWVPHLRLDGLRRYGDGYLAVASYRPSKRLGLATKDRQASLEIQPAGICDHGDGDKGFSPISLVSVCAEYDAKDALVWLCEKLARSPADFGWEDRSTDSFSPALPKSANRVIANFNAEAKTITSANDNVPEDDIDISSAEAVSILDSDRRLADFTRPGGLVEHMIEWVVASSPTPSRELALGAVLAFLASLIGRRYSTGQRDTRANCYIVALAPSGYGKDHSRQQIKRLGEAADGFLDQYFGPERIMSASGLRSALERWPSIVCFMDEFGGFVRDILDKRAGEHKRSISTDLRDYFSASNTHFAGAEYAKAKAVRIYNPNLSIYGTATPGQFWSALSNASAEDGLLPRMLLFDVGDEWPDTVDPTIDVRSVPPKLIERILPLAGIQPKIDRRGIREILDDTAREGGKKPMEPTIVEWTDDALKACRLLTAEARDAARLAPDLMAPFIARLAEHATKLALILAVAHSGKDAQGRYRRPLIDIEKWEWALGLARRCVGDMARSVRDFVSDNEREEIHKAVAAIIQKGGGDGVSRGVVIDKLPKKFSRQLREEVTNDLVESGRVLVVETDTGKAGRKRVRLQWRT